MNESSILAHWRIKFKSKLAQI